MLQILVRSGRPDDLPSESKIVKRESKKSRKGPWPILSNDRKNIIIKQNIDSDNVSFYRERKDNCAKNCN